MPTNTGVISNVYIFKFVISYYKPYKSIAEKATKAVAKRTAAVNLVLPNSFIFLSFEEA